MSIKVKIIAIIASSFSSLLLATEVAKIAQLYGKIQSKQEPKVVDSQLKLRARLIVADRSEITQARIYIKNVAVCEGSVSLCAEIIAVDLGPSPRPGQERNLRKEELREVFNQEFPLHEVDIQVNERPRIITSAKLPETAAVRSLVEQKLLAEATNLHLIVTSLRFPANLKLRHNRYSVEFPSWQQDFALVHRNPRRSLVNLAVRFVDLESGSDERFELIAQVLMRSEALHAVVTRPLARGQLLDQNSVDWQWLPYQEGAIRSPFAIDRQVLRMAARPGQILRSYDLARDPDVKRGEKVQASVQSNGVKMNSTAQALESATIGQRIRVQLETTKRQVMATVTGPSQVEVHMP